MNAPATDRFAPTRIHQLFDRWVDSAPQRVFLHTLNTKGEVGTLRFDELGAWADAAEADLRACGVGPGDRVLIVAENSPAHIALIVACSRLGAWSCGVNARMAPAEIDAFADKADARVCAFTVGASAPARAHAARWSATSRAAPDIVYSRTRSDARPDADERVASIIFTSGTTGASKGVLMTHDGVIHFARVSGASRALDASDRSYAYLPMTHIFGLGTVLMSSLLVGASLVMRASFDPAQALVDLEQHGVTQFQGPPALFARLLAHLDQRGQARVVAPHLRYLYTGAGPLDLALKRRTEAAFGVPLHHGYGLSEYAGALTLGRLGQWREDTASGWPVDGAELQIVDPASGTPLPAGERGEIWMRGVGLMPGYFRDEAATAAVMRPGGWYASGDLGEVSAQDGALHVVGRLKEMIIRSGFNVYPAEVETALNQFQGVARSAVVGQAEGDGNERVIAYVELRPGTAALDAAALDAHLKERLSPYKRPAQVLVVDAFPMTLSGKILKRELLRDWPPAGQAESQR